MDPTNPAFRENLEKLNANQFLFPHRRLVIISGLPNARSGDANPDGWARTLYMEHISLISMFVYLANMAAESHTM